MNFKIFFLLFLVVGCSYQDKNTDVSPHLDLNTLENKHVVVVAPGSEVDKKKLSELLHMVKDRSNIEVLPYENDTKERAEILKKALSDENNDIIWALRGGYGTAKVVEELYDDKEFMLQMKNRKTHPYVIGYSDITALHLFLSQEFGWKTIHGSVFAEITDKTKSKKNFQIISNIFDGTKDIKIYGLEPLNESATKVNEIHGKITGGNLSIIQTSIGTRWQIDSKDKILLVEDCNEEPYKIDRILNHLKSARILDSVKAVIIGDLNNSSNETKKIVKNFAKNMSVPFYSINIFGHSTYNYPFVYNIKGEIKTGKFIYLTQNL